MGKIMELESVVELVNVMIRWSYAAARTCFFRLKFLAG
jgi:hypothetical protein